MHHRDSSKHALHVHDVLRLLDQRHVDHVTPEVEGTPAGLLVLTELLDELLSPLHLLGAGGEGILDDGDLPWVHNL